MVQVLDILLDYCICNIFLGNCHILLKVNESKFPCFCTFFFSFLKETQNRL